MVFLRTIVIIIFCIISTIQIICAQESTNMSTEDNNISEIITTELKNNISAVEDSIIPPIYVVSLERASDRWESAQIQMQIAGLEVIKLPAVDGRQLSKEELKKYSTTLAVFLQPRGVIGCFLSHRKFWQEVVDKKLSSAIVFEDDVQLVDDFKMKLIHNLQRLQADNISYDVLLIGAIGSVNFEGKDNLGHRLFSAYVGGSKNRKLITDYIYQPSRPAGTHAYMISYQGAVKLLERCPKAVFHVDLVAWAVKDLTIRMFHPMLAYQTFEETTLTDVSSSRGTVGDRLVRSRAVQAVNRWAKDPTTQQPVSHILAEPLLKIGKNGPVLTVERHIAVVMWGLFTSAIAYRFGAYHLAYTLAGASATFTILVRSLIALLVRSR